MNSCQLKHVINGVLQRAALMLRCWQVILFGFLVIAAEKINADTCTVYPTADTYVDDSQPSINNGTAAGFAAGTRGGVNPVVHCEAFLAFDTSGTIPADAVVTKVQLKLYEFMAPSDLGYSLTIFSSRSFSENSLTWNTKPSTLLPNGSYGNHGAVSRPSNGQWIFDSVGSMVSYLQNDVNSGSKTYYRIGSGNSFTGGIPFFYSREYSSQAYRPKLIVTYTVPVIQDDWDPVDDTESTATIMLPEANAGVNGSHGPHTVGDGDNADWFKFPSIPVGYRVKYESSGINDVVAELYQYNPNTGISDLVASNDDWGSDGNFKIEYTSINSTYSYRLKVTSYYASSSAAYNLIHAWYYPAAYEIATISNPAAGGSTSGGGSKQAGSPCTVTATEAGGYAFSNWTEGGTVVSTSASYTFPVTGSRTLTANFVNRGTIQFWAGAVGTTINENAGYNRMYVERTGGAGGVASVNYATAGGSAIAGLDYTAASGTLTWANGDSSLKYFDIST